ncbi:MAG: transglutaminase family protein [Candidatus Binatia bacterium]
MKRFLSFAIVLFWLVMVGKLVYRTSSVSHQAQISSAPSPKHLSQAPLNAQEDWMGIYHHDKKIGYFHRRLLPTQTGYRWEERSQMKLRVMNTDQKAYTEVIANIDQRYALQDFSFRLVSSGTVFQVSGAVYENDTAGQELHGQITAGKNSSPFSFALQEPLYLPTLTQMTLHRATLQPGDKRQYSIFNPLTAKTDRIHVTAVAYETLTVHGQTLATTKIAERFGGTTVHAWLDQDGKVVKEEAALGLVLLRESQEQALNVGWQDDTPLDLVSSAAIPVQHALPDPRALTHLRLQLSGPEETTLFAFPPRQNYEEGQLLITSEDLATLTTYKLPVTDPDFAADLGSSPFLQSDHPRLKKQAQQILGAEDDAIKAVQKLLAWTYTSVDKEPTVGMPTALDALDRKKGDCNEHAVLFTALARASGIPARVAAGVVYLDGAFYYHAWAEVWLGQWVSVDPVFNQFPADATHVKFMQGGPEEHVELLKIVGHVRMEVLGYK